MQLRYHTFTSPVEASNFIVVSKSPPVYVNDSANNLSVEATEKRGTMDSKLMCNYRSLKLTPV